MSKSKNITKHYETLESALFDADQPAWEGFERSSRKQTDSSWRGTKDYETAVSLARTGWPDGLKNVSKNVSALTATPSISNGPAVFYDVGGAFPVSALAAAGVAESMVNYAPVSERVRPILRLMIPTMASGSYDENEYMNYGCGFVAVVDSLESNNFRVEITTFIAAECGNEKCLLSVRIKEAQDSVNLDKLAFCLSHVAYFRRVGFALMEKNLNPKNWSETYGRPRIPDPSEIDPDVIMLAGVQQFSCGSRELKSPESSFAAMLPVVSQQLADKFTDFPPLMFSRAA